MKIIDLLTNLKTPQKKELIKSPYHENKFFPERISSKDSLITIIVFLYRKKSTLISIFISSLHMYLTLISVLNPDKITKLIRCIFFLLIIYDLITNIKKLRKYIKKCSNKETFDINRTEDKIIILNIINHFFSISLSIMSLIVDFLNISFDSQRGTIEYMNTEYSGFSISLLFLQIVTFSFETTHNTTQYIANKNFANYCDLLFSVIKFITLIIDMNIGSNLSVYVLIGQLVISLANELTQLFIETETHDNDEKNNLRSTKQAKEINPSEKTYIMYGDNKPKSELIASNPEKNLRSEILQL